MNFSTAIKTLANSLSIGAITGITAGAGMYKYGLNNAAIAERSVGVMFATGIILWIWFNRKEFKEEKDNGIEG